MKDNHLNQFTFTLAPNGVPQNLRLVEVNRYNVTIQWEKLVCIKLNGEISGYVIQYGEMSNIERDEEMIPGTGDEGGVYTITGLTPATDYTIGIAAFSDSGTGPFSWIIVETTTNRKSLSLH